MTYLAVMGRSADPKTRFAEVAKTKGVTYEQFLNAVMETGASRRTASRYWAGETEPRVPELAEICLLLGVSADYFAGLVSDPVPIGGSTSTAEGGAADPGRRAGRTAAGVAARAAASEARKRAAGKKPKGPDRQAEGSG